MSKRNLKWDGQSYLRTFIFWDTLMVVVLVVVAIGGDNGARWWW